MRPGLIHTHEKRLILIQGFRDFHDRLAEPFGALMIQNTMVKACREEMAYLMVSAKQVRE